MQDLKSHVQRIGLLLYQSDYQVNLVGHLRDLSTVAQSRFFHINVDNPLVAMAGTRHMTK